LVIFIKTFLICIIFSANINYLIAEEIPVVDISQPEQISRKKNKDLIQLEIGNENLVIGLSYYRFLNPHNALGLTLGSWLNSFSGGFSYKYFVLESDWSPYAGSSLMFWSMSTDEDKLGNKFQFNIDALGIYLPVGVQYMNKNGFTFSFELAVYFSSTLLVI
jgi:hypothetical protein